jgi:hypothetical protein
MKYPLAIFTAAAAAVAVLLRPLMGDVETIDIDPDAASTVPRITPILVERLAYAGGTDAEIADRFLMDETSLREQYPDVLRAARAVRQMNLRGLQFDLARKLNGPMLIWLGRNELNQSLAPTKLGEAEPDFPAEA